MHCFDLSLLSEPCFLFVVGEEREENRQGEEKRLVLSIRKRWKVQWPMDLPEWLLVEREYYGLLPAKAATVSSAS